MKKLCTAMLCAGVFLGMSCKKQQSSISNSRVVTSAEVLQKIKDLGYSNKNVYKIDSGYLVEGDFILHEQELDKAPLWNSMRIANTEQYRTNVVISNNIPRVINVSVSPELPAFYRDAADIAIARYNAVNMLIRFRRIPIVSFSNTINIWNWDHPVDGVWAAAGPPTMNDPYRLILMNRGFIGTNPDINFLASVIAHEMGHCIGFRHTDFMDRSFSCGGDPFNEGDGGVGAVHIPGTPATPDAASWMLACIGRDQNRPFNANDVTALQFVY